MKTKVLFRNDANNEIGYGHFIRSLALAHMLKNDFDLFFATVQPTDYQKKEIVRIGGQYIELEKDSHFDVFISLLTGDEIVVLDNYFFSSDYQKKIKEKGCKLVCIDDIHDMHFVADVVINHAEGIDTSDYKTEAYTQLFLGLKYAILRPEFLCRKKKTGNEVLISMGGADKNNNTLHVLKLLEQKKKDLDYNIVTGDSFIYQDELKKFAENSSLTLRFFKNLTASEMADLMLRCSAIICPPSTISYEYLSLSGGEMYLNMVADNQKYLYKFFIDNKIAYDVSELIEDKTNNISGTIQAQKKLFDGMSQTRLSDIFRKLKQEQQLSLRDAKSTDIDLYFEWVNDPDGRANAIITNLISYEEHCIWFNRKLKSEGCFLWVLETKGIPIGQIRFEIEGQYVILSYFIDRNYRGRGFGMSIVRLGIYKLLQIDRNLQIKAVVRKGNEASCKIFERLNFKKGIRDHNFYEYIK